MVWVAARLIGIGGVRVQGSHCLPCQHLIRGRKNPFHLIIDHAVDRQGRIHALHLIMPALLAENLLMLVNVRIEYGIQIDLHQVLEILPIAAGHRVNRLVRVGHGIEEGIEGTLDQLHKRILHREFLRPAEHRMLQDMRSPRAVQRRRTEANRKDLILILVGNQADPCPAFLMAQQAALGFDILKIPLFQPFICFAFSYFHTSKIHVLPPH